MTLDLDYLKQIAERRNRRIEAERAEAMKRKSEPKQESKPEIKEEPTNNPIIIPNPNINPREYIQVGIEGLGGKPAVISAYELAGSNDKNYEDTHRFVFENGLYMPTPRIFMTHFTNVIEAKKGNRALNYADGSSVPKSEVEEMFKHLTTNHRNVFGNKNIGVWTWLNAGFDNRNIETITGINSKGKLVKNSKPLENCLMDDCYINPDFNSQGLASPNAKAQNQAYSQGENIYFWFPRNGRVAGFDADSGRADLGCNGNPTGSDSALGVFGCAEGAVPQN